jgi:hypothetical protein
LTIIQAIARMEGWGIVGDLPTRNNNPGDIDNGRFAKAHGAEPGTSGRFAVFETPADGFSALRALLLAAYVGLTVEAALNKYAPPCENQTNAYIGNVCKWTGLTPDTILTVENIG